MWTRKKCAVCELEFAVHPKARKYFTRQLCVQCRLALKNKPLQDRLELNFELSNKEFGEKQND